MFAEMQDQEIFHRALEYGLDYINHSPDRNIFPTAEAIEQLKNFDEPLPDAPGDAGEVIRQLNETGAPATVSQIGGRFFGFVNGAVVPAGMAAKILATFWDQNTAMYVMSPLVSKLESVVEKWLQSVFNLPEQTVAGFVSGTSTANLCGLAAARYRLLQNQGWDINRKGFLNAPPIKVIAGEEVHSSVIKTISLLGFGNENIQFIETDDQGRIKIDNIPPLDNTTLLILSAGNVNTGSFDHFTRICKQAREAGAWVHVDGAFGLWAAASAQLSYLTDGMEYAHSWAVDGHKTLNTPYDSGIILCADKESLKNALHAAGGYLVISEDRDGMFFTPEMSRRARIIELWATMKYLGKQGMDDMITTMHERARQFEKELAGLEGFTVLNEVVFNQVLVACETDELTLAVIKNIQEERVCWLGGSVWQGKRVIRISVCSWATTEQDVRLSVDSFKSSLEKARALRL